MLVRGLSLRRCLLCAVCCVLFAVCCLMCNMCLSLLVVRCLLCMLFR